MKGRDQILRAPATERPERPWGLDDFAGVGVMERVKLRTVSTRAMATTPEKSAETGWPRSSAAAAAPPPQRGGLGGGPLRGPGAAPQTAHDWAAAAAPVWGWVFVEATARDDGGVSQTESAEAARSQKMVGAETARPPGKDPRTPRETPPCVPPRKPGGVKRDDYPPGLSRCAGMIGANVCARCSSAGEGC